MGGDDVGGHLADGVGLGTRVDGPTTHLLTHLLQEGMLHRVHDSPPPRVLQQTKQWSLDRAAELRGGLGGDRRALGPAGRGERKVDDGL